jgi:hypothetical protein
MTTLTQKIKDPDIDPEPIYFLNANSKYPKEGYYNVDLHDKKCYAFSKDIKDQHMGKPQMTCTFDIIYLKKLYQFIIDNKEAWKDGNSHLKYEIILKFSRSILHYFIQYTQIFSLKLSKEIEYYEGIFIYLLTYYVNLEFWDKRYYFKAMFSFKTRTNPILLLGTDGGIIHMFSEWLLGVISEKDEVKPLQKVKKYIYFIKRCCESIKQVLYIKNHPILPDRYFDQEFDKPQNEAKIMELLDGKFKRVYYCNPSGKEEENTLGKIGLIKGKLVFDAYSVEVFEWPPEDDRRISIECRSFHNMIYLSYRKLLKERLDNFDDPEDIKIDEENDEKTDKDIEKFIEKKSEAYHCGHLYSLIKLLFKYIFSVVFNGEKNFVFGIEFETSLLIYNMEYKDRKAIWGWEHSDGPQVTVTSEIVQTVKKHLPYKDGKYYDCYGDYAPYSVDEISNALRCIYALEGQIGVFNVDLSQPKYDLTTVKECISMLCVYILAQKKDPQTVVEKIFTCPKEKRQDRSPRRQSLRERTPSPIRQSVPLSPRRERTPSPSRFKSKTFKKKSKKTPKKKSKKTPKRSLKKPKNTSKKSHKKKSKKTPKNKSKKTPKNKSKKTPKKKSKKG